MLSPVVPCCPLLPPPAVPAVPAVLAVPAAPSPRLSLLHRALLRVESGFWGQARRLVAESQEELLRSHNASVEGELAAVESELAALKANAV